MRRHGSSQGTRPPRSGRPAIFNAGLLVFLGALAVSCILNPHPEPPSDEASSGPGGRPGTGGSGGAGGSIDPGGNGGAGGTSGSGTGGAIGTGGSGGTGGGPVPPCARAADCVQGSVCSADSGQCSPTPPAACGLPADEGGSAPERAPCDAGNRCAPGLKCVPFQRALTSANDYQAQDSGLCLRACDPCAPACANGESCFAGGIGGFCAGALLAESAACDPALPPIVEPSAVPCAGGLTCAEVDLGSGFGCLRYCRPEPGDAGPLASHPDRSASPSVDCPLGSICVETYAGSQSTSAGEFVCVVGTLSDPGAACGAAVFCRAPARCEGGSCVEP
jgi:hypothetical protein